MPDHSINERIIEFAKLKRLDEMRFSEAIGHDNPQKTYNVFSKKTGVSTEYLKDVLNAFKELSANWLILGEGNIYRHQPEYVINDSNNLSFEEPSTVFVKKEEVEKTKNEVHDLKIECNAYLKAFEAIGRGQTQGNRSNGGTSQTA